MLLNHGYSIKTNENRCLNQYHEGVNCTHCIEHCPTEAIYLDNNRIVLNTDLCNGCGLCLSDCPTQAFSSSQWDETTVIKAVEKEKWKITEIFCARHKAPYKKNKDKERGAVQLQACLSTISKGCWYELGLKTELDLHREECEACPMSKTLSRLEYDIGTAAEWIKASGKEVNVNFIFEKVNGTSKRNLRALETGLKVSSRRELFVSLIDRGRNELINKVNEIASLPASTEKSKRMRPGSCLPEWRKRLANIYPKNQTNVSSPAYWPTTKIDDNCIKCEMCSKFCPVGALQTKVENGTITHYFTNGLCIDCRTCQLFCPRQAITRDREPIDNPFDTVAISSKSVDVCQACGKPTYGKSKHLCYMCEQDEANNLQLVKACKEIFSSN